MDDLQTQLHSDESSEADFDYKIECEGYDMDLMDVDEMDFDNDALWWI